MIGFLVIFLTAGVIISLILTNCDTRKKQNTSENSKTQTHLDSTKYIPKPIGWTNDFVHLFSKHEIESLDSLMDSYEKKTTVQFSVATIDSAMMGPIDFESYTLLMLRTWGVGTKSFVQPIGLGMYLVESRRVRVLECSLVFCFFPVPHFASINEMIIPEARKITKNPII